ncbi:MAG: transporter [Alphaproteobacteria bacterium]|nr:transporter [Alphaproteobacteria bacterium]MBU1515186.1 transporter [Alphaproteobacteria bacterium]MBU2092316.1 transporter [Alphaproteobacteria bacterium]MBU2152910.1 transporter [Alphaproteobacteria bacterium]MBU2305741.1 transporter [Alphaproteobacteria bacterium]
MLKGLDPLLGPDLLAALRAMGHGDELAIVDANFPATALARRLCREDGVDAVRMLAAVGSVLSLDDFGAVAAWRMGAVDPAEEPPAIVGAFAQVLSAAGYDGAIGVLAREAFYQRAAEAFVVVATGEARLYGNLILRKGVIRPPRGVRA